MRRTRGLGLPLACLAAALLLHKAFCEWRTVEYAIADSASHEALLLLPVRTLRQRGNAKRWDEQERALRVYDAAWLDCHRALHGEPEPGGELATCIAARPYTRIGTTAEAVAIGECERELYGRVRQAAKLAICLEARGYQEVHVPRWASERIGRRFDEPYLTRTALFAEAWLGSAAADRWVAVLLGVLAPLAFVALALHGMGRRER